MKHLTTSIATETVIPRSAPRWRLPFAAFVLGRVDQYVAISRLLRWGKALALDAGDFVALATTAWTYFFILSAPGGLLSWFVLLVFSCHVFLAASYWT